MNKTKTNTDFELITLLNETHDKMYEMMEWCERLQPVQLTHQGYLSDITDEKEMMKTKLFRLKNTYEMTDFNDQTNRSLLKDIRKYIRDLEQ
jgi:hypothetical protein